MHGNTLLRIAGIFRITRAKIVRTYSIRNDVLGVGAVVVAAPADAGGAFNRQARLGWVEDDSSGKVQWIERRAGLGSK